MDKFDDKYFAKQGDKKKKTDAEFFESEKQEKSSLPAERKDDQKSVDAPLIKALEAAHELKSYLAPDSHWDLA